MAEKLALLAELERSGETFGRFRARRRVISATLCKRRHRLAESGEAGLAEREPARHRAGRTARARSAEERRRAVEVCAQSGMTVRDFARTWGLSTKTLNGWLAIYRIERSKGLEPRSRGPRRGARGRGEGRDAGGARAATSAGSSASAGSRASASTAAGTDASSAPMSPSAPRSLPAGVHDEIARTKLRFPDFGLERIRDLLARFHGVSVSPVARTVAHGQ